MLHDPATEADGPVVVSRHADKRVRQRMGLKRSAVQRTVEKAWREGVPIRDLNGREVGTAQALRLWAGFVFMFARRISGETWCVTVVREITDEDASPSAHSVRVARAKEANRRRREARATRIERVRRHKRDISARMGGW